MDVAMEPVIWEWVNFMVRWLHVVTAIAWIGSSFYFIHLDASLRRREGLPAGAAGEAWQIHGGGFYHMVKYTVAPDRLPTEMTWFKWESYATWLSGFFLLCVLYYRGADLFLVDADGLAPEPWQAAAISAGSLVLGWFAYDLMCRSRLGRSDGPLAAAGFVLIVLAAWGFAALFTGRGALLQVGALIGTMMTANVFMVIIPNQKKVVADLLAGRTPDPSLGRQAKQRSLHNNYLTLPVVFFMISNHYPLAFATGQIPAIVALVLVAGAVIRHFFNSRHAGRPSPWWTWGVAAAGMAGVVWLSTLSPAFDARHAQTGTEPSSAPDFAEVEDIVIGRCSMCHAAMPVWEGIPAAPRGILLDTPEEIVRNAPLIRTNATLSDAMPPGNVTLMTPEERRVLEAWAASVAAGR